MLSMSSSPGTVLNLDWPSTKQWFCGIGFTWRGAASRPGPSGLRRRELAELTLESLQRREERWAIVDLIGKGRHIRTVPVPNWVKETLDAWLTAAGIESGPLFRCVCRAGKPWGQSISEKTVWHVVKKTAASMNIPSLAPHDLRRSCARLCHDSGGELEQIQFLLGHVSVQTTERYIGCKQHLRIAVNDRLGIEPG